MSGRRHLDKSTPGTGSYTEKHTVTLPPAYMNYILSFRPPHSVKKVNFSDCLRRLVYQHARSNPTITSDELEELRGTIEGKVLEPI